MKFFYQISFAKKSREFWTRFWLGGKKYTLPILKNIGAK